MIYYPAIKETVTVLVIATVLILAGLLIWFLIDKRER